MASGHVNRILKAEHMAAPTNAAKREESSCQLGAVHTWHKASIPECPLSGRYWSKSGHVRNGQALRTGRRSRLSSPFQHGQLLWVDISEERGDGFCIRPRVDLPVRLRMPGDLGTTGGRSLRSHPLLIGNATNFVASAVFTRSRTSCLPWAFASVSALRTSPALATVLPPTSRMMSPVLKP
jgi:hypothetical protein